MGLEQKNFDTVIFDLDGTLLDTLDDLYHSVNAALIMNRFPKRTKEEVRSFLGSGVYWLIERSVPEGTSREDMERVLKDYQAYYAEHCEDQTKVFDGLMEVLKSLRQKGYRMAIVSNKADAAVQELQNKYFHGVIDVAIGERTGVNRKPAPDTVFQAMQKLGVSKETVLYMGDSEVDRETAENAGIPCVLVKWGFRDEDFLQSLKPEFFIRHPEELYSILGIEP